MKGVITENMASFEFSDVAKATRSSLSTSRTFSIGMLFELGGVVLGRAIDDGVEEGGATASAKVFWPGYCGVI